MSQHRFPGEPCPASLPSRGKPVSGTGSKPGALKLAVLVDNGYDEAERSEHRQDQVFFLKVRLSYGSSNRRWSAFRVAR
jgi:hypothetical protein